MLLSSVKLVIRCSMPQKCSHCHFLKWTAERPRLQMQEIRSWRYFQGQSKGPDSKVTKKRTSLIPEVEQGGFQFSERRFGRLLRPLGFTVMFSCCSFAGAAIWQYETVRRRVFNAWNRSSNWTRDQWSSPRKFALWRAELNRHWNNLSEGQRVALGIIAANTLVFCLWRIPIIQPMMIKYFSSNPVAKAICWPMVLSTFSHYSFWHLGINMYVLYTFSTGLTNVLGREQFLALYLSAGAVSSFTSYLHKIATMRTGLSLGASGCLMGVLGFFCTQFPDSRLTIVFLPMFSFSADTGLKSVIAIDLLGIILRWQMFDHAAHLGGVAFGITYALWGRKYIWEQREPFLRWWDRVRRSNK